MANRFKSFIESIVYVGMKSGPSKPQERSLGWLGPLRQPVEHLLSPTAQNDPLYLSNRTFSQKVKHVVLIAIPVVVVVGCVVAGLEWFGPKARPGAKELTPAEISAKMLPSLSKEIKVDVNKDIELVEVRIDHTSGEKLVGSVKNLAGHLIPEAEVVFDVTNAEGSQLGSVTVKVTNIDGAATRTFEQPIELRNAVYALVREVRTK